MNRLLLVLALSLLLLSGCAKRKQHTTAPYAPAPAAQALAFTALWCGPCQQAKVRLREAGVEPREVDIDRQPELASQWGVSSVPTFFVRTSGGDQRTQDVSVVLQLLGGSYDR